MDYQLERSTAIQAVLKASRLCQSVGSSLVMDKSDRSPVTVADFGAQALISLDIMKAFPDDPIAAEEDSSLLRSQEAVNLRIRVLEHINAITPGLKEDEVLAAIDYGGFKGGPRGRFWTIDPIDGTKGFLRGEQYAVALALIEDGEVVLGVLGCPNLPLRAKDPGGAKGCLFIAVRGQGAVMRSLSDNTEIPIGASQIEDLSVASFCESVESSHSSHGDAMRIAEVLGIKAPPLRIDSQCKYAVLARGDASIYMRLPTSDEYVERIWDHAAGWIIVKEAGGEVTDAYGFPLDFSLGRGLSRNKGIVGTNGKLHPVVISAVRRILGTK